MAEKCALCEDPLETEETLACSSSCGKTFHLSCSCANGLESEKYGSAETWKCVECEVDDDYNSLVSEVVELNQKRIADVEKEMNDMKDSMDFMNDKFEEFLSYVKNFKKSVDNLRKDTNHLISTVATIETKLDSLEQKYSKLSNCAAKYDNLENPCSKFTIPVLSIVSASKSTRTSSCSDSFDDISQINEWEFGDLDRNRLIKSASWPDDLHVRIVP